MNHILWKVKEQHHHDLLNRHKGHLRKSWDIIKDIIHKNENLCVNQNF